MAKIYICYAIQNTLNGKTYIGTTSNFKSRRIKK